MGDVHMFAPGLDARTMYVDNRSNYLTKWLHSLYYNYVCASMYLCVYYVRMYDAGMCVYRKSTFFSIFFSWVRGVYSKFVDLRYNLKQWWLLNCIVIIMYLYFLYQVMTFQTSVFMIVTWSG